MVAGAMADGYTTASDSYDGYMYVFGKVRARQQFAPGTAISQGQSAAKNSMGSGNAIRVILG